MVGICEWKSFKNIRLVQFFFSYFSELLKVQLLFILYSSSLYCILSFVSHLKFSFFLYVNFMSISLSLSIFKSISHSAFRSASLWFFRNPTWSSQLSSFFHLHLLLFPLKIPFLLLNCPKTFAFPNALNLIADQNSHLSISAQNINWIYHVAFIDELSRALLCMLHISPQQKPTNNTNIWLTTELRRWGGLWPRPQPTPHSWISQCKLQTLTEGEGLHWLGTCRGRTRATDSRQ